MVQSLHDVLPGGDCDEPVCGGKHSRHGDVHGECWVLWGRDHVVRGLHEVLQERDDGGDVCCGGHGGRGDVHGERGVLWGRDRLMLAVSCRDLFIFW